MTTELIPTNANITRSQISHSDIQDVLNANFNASDINVKIIGDIDNVVIDCSESTASEQDVVATVTNNLHLMDI